MFHFFIFSLTYIHFHVLSVFLFFFPWNMAKQNVLMIFHIFFYRIKSFLNWPPFHSLSTFGLIVDQLIIFIDINAITENTRTSLKIHLFIYISFGWSPDHYFNKFNNSVEKGMDDHHDISFSLTWEIKFDNAW